MGARREEEDTSGMNMQIRTDYDRYRRKPRSIADKICDFLEDHLP